MISKLRQVNWKSRKVAARVVFILVIALVFWVALAYLFHDDMNDEPPESMFQLFQTPAYERLISRLNRNNRTVITGRQEDGLNVFIHYYVQ